QLKHACSAHCGANGSAFRGGEVSLVGPPPSRLPNSVARGRLAHHCERRAASIAARALSCVPSPAPPPVMIVPPMPTTIAPPNGLGELAGGRRLIDRNAIGRHRRRAGHRKQTERES